MNLIFKMSFLELDIPISFTTSSNDPIKEFFDPVLAISISYDIAVGYFSSNWIRDAAKGIAMFAKNGGHSRWIISPQLNEEDWKLLSESKNMEDKKKIVENISIRSIEELQTSLELETRTTIGWLINDKILEFKLAVPKNNLHGIFHAKIGVLKDFDGNKIAFTGSYNLTGAANTNWEVLDIFRSWKSNENERVDRRESDFDNMWSKNDPNLEVYIPTDKTVQKFIEITKFTTRPYKQVINTLDSCNLPRIPDKFLNQDNNLLDHQEKAINEWIKNNGHGIFHMATGSGKTVTALSSIVRILDHAIYPNNSKIMVVVTVPYKHLADQWKTEAEAFGFNPQICYDNYANWLDKAKNSIHSLKLNQSTISFFIVANATFIREPFQNLLDSFNGNFLFIADEMHNLGGDVIKKLLPDRANWRIGLSATPDRLYDEEGTVILKKYFGKTVIKYEISDAIRDGTLCPYYYHVIQVPLTDDEMDEYRSLSISISRLSASNNDNNDLTSESSKFLLIKRARLIANAENKIPILKKLLQKDLDSNYNLIYCGDMIYEDEKQVETILKMVGVDLGIKANKITAQEKNDVRQQLLSDFSLGKLQALVAIKCLDEGVDVPRTETAYILASSANSRQFVQRRGRVLRRAPGKKDAKIYDFLAIPPLQSNSDTADSQNYSYERKLMINEFKRVDEFANICLNKGEVLKNLREIKKRLNLLDY
jgi:superfamily II DNA or RNA helicase